MSDLPQPSPAIEPTFAFDVRDVAGQAIRIHATGPSVLLIKDYVRDQDADSYAVTPDWLEIFARAADLGMFSGAHYQPWKSAARILEKDFQSDTKSATWQVSLRDVDRGAFRVLWNVFRGRDLEQVRIRSENAPLTAPGIQLDTLGYPAAYTPAPFPVSAEWTPRPLRDRSVQVVFQREIDENLLEACYLALETWTNLLLLGGYPTPRVHPKMSALLPDVAFQLDGFTVAQEFPEIFDCDEACFSCVVNWAHRMHQLVCPVEMVTIR